MKRILLVVIAIAFLGSFVISIINYKRISTLEYNYQVLSKKQDKEIKETREAVKILSGYFENKGNLTIDAVLQAYQEFNDVIAVYDNNVLIYNKRITDLQSQVNSIINYLSR